MTSIDRPLEADFSLANPTEEQARALAALAELREAMWPLVSSRLELLAGVDPHLTAIRRIVLGVDLSAPDDTVEE